MIYSLKTLLKIFEFKMNNKRILLNNVDYVMTINIKYVFNYKISIVQ
jgi:hypothetical protein